MAEAPSGLLGLALSAPLTPTHVVWLCVQNRDCISFVFTFC